MLVDLGSCPQENFEFSFFSDVILGNFGMIFNNEMHFNIALFTT